MVILKGMAENKAMGVMPNLPHHVSIVAKLGTILKSVSKILASPPTTHVISPSLIFYSTTFVALSSHIGQPGGTSSHSRGHG